MSLSEGISVTVDLTGDGRAAVHCWHIAVSGTTCLWVEAVHGFEADVGGGVYQRLVARGPCWWREYG